MHYIAKKSFSATAFGNVEVGDIIEVPDGLAQQWIEHGMIAPMEVAPGNARGGAGAGAPSPSSPAAQASNSGNVTFYETKPMPSRPTVPSGASAPRAASTDATTRGGSDTTGTSKPKGTRAGRKTRKPRPISD